MSQDDILMRDIWLILTRSKALIFTVTATMAALAVAAAFVMTPVYRATVIMTPASSGDSDYRLPSALGSLGGLAALAGVGREGDIKDEALATITSRSFTERFISDRALLPQLFPDRWIESEERWMVDEEPPPDLADGYRLLSGLTSVSEDRLSGIVTLSFEWYEPGQVADIANGLVSSVNEHLRERAIVEAERSIAFLQRELDKTRIVELQRGIYRLIEGQINRAMLARVREQYAFRVIDPAATPDVDGFVRPRRVLMIASGLLFGFLGGCMLAVLRRQLTGADNESRSSGNSRARS